mgnify:CR=1 FL=1
MKESIFRKKSIDRVNSPEQLDEYIRVASPGVWLVLTGIAVLLVGFVVWGIFGTIETTKNVEVVCSGEKLQCYIKPENADSISEGMPVTVNGQTGTVLAVSDMPVMLPENADPYLLYIGGYSAGDFAYTAEIAVDGLPDGVYEAKVITESIKPISFVIQ